MTDLEILARLNEGRSSMTVSNRNLGWCVHRRTAERLEREGLAKIRYSYTLDRDDRLVITDAGRDALKAAS